VDAVALMLQLDKSFVSVGGVKAIPLDRASPREMIKSFIDLLRRQLPIISFSVLLSTGIGVAYLLTTPPMFTAQTSMIIDTHKIQIFQKPEQTSNSNVVDSGMVDSEIEMLRSENVILAVIKRFDLANDPEFDGRGSDLFHAILGKVSDLFHRREILNDYERTRRAVVVFENRLTVKRLGLSYIIQVSFVSLDPKRAADIADAVANEYILDQLQAKFQAARQAGGWLRDRLQELREQAAAAERAVVDFKIQNSIVSTGGPDKRLVHEQQVAELNSQLVIARAQVSEAGARLERIEAVARTESPDSAVDATVTDTLKDEVIIKLRSQYLALAEREADWSRKYGNTHLAVVNLRGQMSEIRHSIFDELQRIAQTYRSDYAIAKQRQAGLERQLADAVSYSQGADRAQVQLTQLESSAQSYRALYDDFLRRYTESVQAQSWPVTEARVVTPASQPLTKSNPKTAMVLIISALGGGVLGLLFGHLRDLTDRVFRTRDQVEQLLGLDCLATVPNIKISKSKGDSSSLSQLRASVAPHETSLGLRLPPAPNLKPNGPSSHSPTGLELGTAESGDERPSSSIGDAEELKGQLAVDSGDSEARPDVRDSGEAVPAIPVEELKNVLPAPDERGERYKLAGWHQFVGRRADDTPPPAKVGLSEDRMRVADSIDDTRQQRIIARRDALMWQVADFPLSPYTEAVRSIKLAIDLLRVKVPKKARKPKNIIGITSTSPGEGKSTISASLAQLIANADKHVLLIDCDLRAPRLSRTLAPNAKLGLLEVMSGDASLDDVIWTDQSKRLNFLPAVATSRIPHTAEIIAADELRALLDRLRGAYDYIIVDLTPLVPIVDVRATQGLIDNYIFVVEWGRTSIDLVQRSLKDAVGIYNNTLGVVLNKVGTNELKRYEGYGAYGHDKYYQRDV
jgi:capsular exopolysaccharide synthesis family protein